MANSGSVTVSDLVLYTQYNNLRDDVLNASTGHGHTGGTDEGKKLSGAIIGGSVNWSGYSLGSPGSISGTPKFTGTPAFGSVSGNPEFSGTVTVVGGINVGAGKSVSIADAPLMMFVDFADTSTYSGTSDAFEDWDLSGTIPTKCAAVCVAMINLGTAAIDIGIRTNGGSCNRYLSHPANTGWRLDWTKPDANRIIERYAENKDDAAFKLMGWLV